MAYHCSLSAFGIPKSRASRKIFIPPPRTELPPKWNTAEEMIREIGFYPGEWKISRRLVGHLQGLMTPGHLMATDKTRALFMGDDGKTRIIHKYNFVQHYEERGSDL